MSLESAWSHLKEERSFYLLLLILAVAAVSLLSLVHNEVMGEIAKALIVAVVLAATVDTYLKSRLAREVVTKVSPYVMAHALPSELQREVNTICELKSYRTNFELSYEIERLEGTDNALKVTCFVSYNLVNITNEYVPCSHLVWVEKDPEGRLSKQIGAVGAEGVYQLNKEPLPKYDGEVASGEIENVTGGLRWRRQLLLPPNDHPPARFWQTTYQVFPVERYEPFITTVALVGATVRISHPNWLEVGVHFEHRLEDDYKHRKEGTRTVWEFKHALLPYSTIAVTWHRKQPEST